MISWAASEVGACGPRARGIGADDRAGHSYQQKSRPAGRLPKTDDRAGRPYLLLRRRVIDLEIVDQAALAGDTEFIAGLGGMSDTRGLEVTDGLAIEDDAYFVADDFNDERLPFAGFDVSWERKGTTDEELGDFGLLSRIVLHLVDVVAHATVFFVDDLNGTLFGLGIITNLGAADVAVVATREITIVEFDINHRGAVEFDAAFDDGILVRNFETEDSRVSLDGDGLTILGENILHAGLGAEQGTIDDSKSRDDFDPALVGSAGEIISEEQIALLGDGVSRNGREFRSVGRESGGDEEERQEGAHGERCGYRCKGAKVQR